MDIAPAPAVITKDYLSMVRVKFSMQYLTRFTPRGKAVWTSNAKFAKRFESAALAEQFLAEHYIVLTNSAFVTELKQA